MRGVMTFEDFNYETFNKLILIDQNNRNYEDVENYEDLFDETED